MNDWRSNVGMTKREMLRVAAAILGLLAGCVLAIWLLTRLIPRDVNPQPAPQPAKTGQQAINTTPHAALAKHTLLC